MLELLESLRGLIEQGHFAIAALAAFAGGVLSFFLPCVLPLVPAYLSFVSGASIQDLKQMPASESLRRVLLRTVAFILGFSVVYTAFGMLAGAAAVILKQVWFPRAAGVLLVVLGLHLAGVLKIAALHRERRVQVSRRPASPWGAFAVGIAFAFGWSPCTGPVLGGILTVAATRGSVGGAVFLLALYSLGLGVPFLVSALAINVFFKLFDRVKRWLGVIEIASGVILILFGLALIIDPTFVFRV